MHINPPADQPDPSSLPLEFGYNPPTGARGIERINPATFVRDPGSVLDFASGAFDSIWISDHLMTGARFRLECWTLLTWIATRYPTMALGTNVIRSILRTVSWLSAHSLVGPERGHRRGRVIGIVGLAADRYGSHHERMRKLPWRVRAGAGRPTQRASGCRIGLPHSTG